MHAHTCIVVMMVSVGFEGPYEVAHGVVAGVFELVGARELAQLLLSLKFMLPPFHVHCCAPAGSAHARITRARTRAAIGGVPCRSVLNAFFWVVFAIRAASC